MGTMGFAELVRSCFRVYVEIKVARVTVLKKLREKRGDELTPRDYCVPETILYSSRIVPTARAAGGALFLQNIL